MLGSEGLSTTEDDTVDHNQWDKQSEGCIDIRQEGLDNQLQHGDKGSNHHDEYGDAHLVGSDRLEARDNNIGTDEHSHCGQSHGHTVDGTSGGGQRGTHTQHKDERWVLLDDAILDDTYVIHSLFYIDH